MTDESLPQELRDLLDREQVVSLMNRYFATLDNRVSIDAVWARALFSDDVRIDHRGFVLAGIEEVAAGHRFVIDGWDRTVHFATNPRVELNADRAHLDARLLAIHVHREGGPAEPYVIANTFGADAVRTSDGWRFQSINQHTVWSRGQSHLDIARSDT